MARIRFPRSGSMQFWPRVRAKRSYPRMRTWPISAEKKILGFLGYKAGMGHAVITDNRANSITKGKDIVWPVTILECPAIKVASVVFYKNFNIIGEIFGNVDKELERKITVGKSKKTFDDMKDFDELKIKIYSQPKLTGIGKKKPELFEVGLGGNKDDKLKIAKELLGKEIPINHVFKEGQFLDVKSITKGKGFQGPVKRFGVSIRQHKAEKTKRGPGSLGGWKAQGHTMYRVAHAGKMGYHQRMQNNILLLKIGTNGKEVSPVAGFVHYGNVKSSYIILKGSVPGPKKRAIILSDPLRGKKAVAAPVMQKLRVA